MSMFDNAAATDHGPFGFKANDKDVPPSGSPEEMIARISLATRLAASENVIKSHVMIALSLGLIPIPVFDVAILTANQVKMVKTLGSIYGEQSFRDSRIRAMILSLISGTLPVLGVVGLSSGLKLMPGIGSLLGSGSVAVSGGVLTYAVGRVFVKHFESGGTYLDLDMNKARDQLKEEMSKGSAFVSNLKRKAQKSQSGAA